MIPCQKLGLLGGGVGILNSKPNDTHTDSAQGSAESLSQRLTAQWWETDEQNKYEGQ